MGTRDELTRDGDNVRRGSLTVWIVNVNYNLLDIIYLLNIILGSPCHYLLFACFYCCRGFQSCAYALAIF